MFMHRNRGRYARAASLGMLTALGTTAVARAAETSEPLVLVAYSNRAGGARLLSGDYGSAAQAVQRPSNAFPDPQALNTNRCVAYAMTQQLSQARTACDAAVREAQSPDSMLVQWNARLRQQATASAAVAYSNRAVLHWLNAEGAAARQDLARAQALAPDANFVARNLSAINARQNPSTQITATTAATVAHE
jgi:hypothetical protein